MNLMQLQWERGIKVLKDDKNLKGCLILIIKMGTTNSKISQQQPIQHQRFEHAKFLGDDEIEMQVRTTLDDYNTWRGNLKKINFTNKENILFPLNHSFQEQGWCSQNTGIVKITYDNYPFVFEQELDNRISLNRHLSQQQMWYLLYTLVSTAKDFSFINRKVGDIRPHNIFVNSAGQIKLGVCFSWPNQPSNIQKTMNDREITYLAPEELQICKQHKIDTLVNSILAQSFSIGLTMLHAGLLESVSLIYNMDKFQINRKAFAEKIHSWMELEFKDENNQKVTYSQSLKQIIKNLCVYDQNMREKSTEIFTLLQPHKQAILNIEPFQVNYKTQKLPLSNIKQQSNQLNQLQAIQSSLNHPLQKSIGFPVYHYGELSKAFPSTQTPISVNPNADWSTRTFTQVPVNKNPPTTAVNYSFQLFDKYANTANSPPRNSDLALRMPNTVISQGQSIETKPIYNLQSSITKQQNTVIVRPFMSIDEQTQPNSHYRSQHHMSLEKQVQKKVQSNDFIQIPPQYREKQQFTVNQFTTSLSGPATTLDSDFLKRIDEQIQKSKSMFPS